MKLFLLPLLLCFSSCSPQSPYAGVEVNAVVRIHLEGNKSSCGVVEEVTKAGIQISRTELGYASPLKKKAGELASLEEHERVLREKFEGQKTYIEFYPWASIVSVTIERPANRKRRWLERVWN